MWVGYLSQEDKVVFLICLTLVCLMKVFYIKNKHMYIEICITEKIVNRNGWLVNYFSCCRQLNMLHLTHRSVSQKLFVLFNLVNVCYFMFCI